MKRFLFVMAGVVVSAYMGTMMSQWVMGATSPDALLDKLFGEAGVDRTPEASYEDLESLSAADKHAFENLYLFVYQNVKEVPQTKTLEQMVVKTDYNEDQLRAILYDGNVQVLQKELGTEDREQLLEAWSDLEGLYDQEFTFQSDNLSLTYETLAQTMFVNNDLADSGGVDLLNDLSFIHYIFFNDFIQYPDRGGEDSVELASIEEDFPVQLTATNDAPQGLLNPYLCLDDEDLSDELDSFNDVLEGTAPQDDPRYDVLDADPPREEKPAPGSAQEILEREEPVSIDEFDALIGTLAATKGQWDRSLPCNDIFCIEINLVKGSIGTADAENTYEETDNCIACHVYFIRERMEDTLGKPLAGSKVSMNWFEDATCKDGGTKVNLDLNIIPIAVPIQLDPGDTIDEVPAKNQKDLQKSLEGAGALPSADQEVGLTLSDLECSRYLEFNNNIGGGVSIEDAAAACELQSLTFLSRVEDLYDSAEFDLSAQVDQNYAEQVKGELSTFLLFLQNFNQGLIDTYMEDDAPLSRLLDKEYCK